jgi:hypothetical protein
VKLTRKHYPALIKNVLLLLGLQYVHFFHLLKGEYFQRRVVLDVLDEHHSAEASDADRGERFQILKLDAGVFCRVAS